MKPPDWDRLQDIYHEAIEKPEPERIEFLEKACAGNPSLLRQAISLVMAHNSAGIIDSCIDVFGSTDLVGETIGDRYLVQRRLDGGGMSEVYVATDQRVQNERVAIKVLKHDLVQEPYAQQKFAQEVEALVRVKHVVHARDSGKLPDGKPYFVMDYVAGVTLKSQIESDAIDLKRAASILRQLGAVLTQVHQKGIVHRDLKPANVMLTSEDDSVVLLDFGIAKVQDSVVASDTVMDVSPGTPPYMSPEQLGHEAITPASDIYSMGVVAYEMICGEKPFNPDATRSLLELQRKGIGRLPPKISTNAQHILRRALSFEPQNRNRTAKDFGDKLAAALAPSPAVVIEPGTIARVVAYLLILSAFSFGFYKYWKWKGISSPTRSFTYWLNVQEREGKDYKPARKSNGDEPFRNGDKYQLNVETPVAAYLYVFRETSSASDGINFRMLYPTDSGAAALGPDQTIQSEWMTFPELPGTENFWLVWSLTPVPQLESAKTEAFKNPDRGLTDQPLIAVQQFLQSRKPASTWHYEAQQNAKPREKSDLIIALAQFKHK